MSTRDYYEGYWSEGGHGPVVRQELYPALRDLLEENVTGTSRCIDVGCGAGRTCGIWLTEHCASYTGVDVAESAIKEARALGLNAHLIEDAGALPFPDNSFDVAVCTEVLEHLFDPGSAAREIFRVLQPGGVLIATVPNVAYWRRRLDLLAGNWDPGGDFLQPSWDDPHLRFFTSRSFKSMLTLAGFHPVNVSGHHGGVLPELPFARRAKRWLMKTSFGNIPDARRFVARRRSSRLYRRLERLAPSLLAQRLHAIATKPL